MPGIAMMGGDMMGGGMMAAMGIWAVVLIATVLAVLVAAVLASIWLVRRLRHDRGDQSMLRDGADAADILQRRYAAGEIDDDEYQRRRSALSRP
ncbi:SHOCT domain-containing protein [Pseudonocardia sp.]|uniref:SHOCT domain-containing protein n=1 Tax=Pseudonocardia sp. TaxID=60912 RepID=UPI003D10098F